jgi:predicted nucleic acid-binding protein
MTMMNSVRVAIDTNVLAYAEGLGDSDRVGRAIDLLRRLRVAGYVLPLQVAGELCRVLFRKGGRTRAEAVTAARHWIGLAEPCCTSAQVFEHAWTLVESKGLDMWDAIVLSVAAEAECRLLLSEDMHDGFVWRGVTVANPFAKQVHPLLASVIGDTSQ